MDIVDEKRNASSSLQRLVEGLSTGFIVFGSLMGRRVTMTFDYMTLVYACHWIASFMFHTILQRPYYLLDKAMIIIMVSEQMSMVYPNLGITGVYSFVSFTSARTLSIIAVLLTFIDVLEKQRFLIAFSSLSVIMTGLLFNIWCDIECITQKRGFYICLWTSLFHVMLGWYNFLWSSIYHTDDHHGDLMETFYQRIFVYSFIAGEYLFLSL